MDLNDCKSMVWEPLEVVSIKKEVFNSDELPKPTDLIEATAETKDLININELKDSNLKRMDFDQKLKNYDQSCTAGHSVLKKEFVTDFEQKLKNLKQEYKPQNQFQCEKVVLITHNLLTDSINEYNQRMDNLFDSFSSVDQMSETHKEVKQRSSDQFNLLSPFKDQSFLNHYFIQFDRDIKKSFEEFKIKFTERQESLRNAFNIKVSEAKNSYIQEMETNFVGNVLTDEEMQECHEKCRQQSIDTFNSNSIDVNNVFDVNKYSSNLKQLIEKEFGKFVEQNHLSRGLRKRDLNDIVNESASVSKPKIKVKVDKRFGRKGCINPKPKCSKVEYKQMKVPKPGFFYRFCIICKIWIRPNRRGLIRHCQGNPGHVQKIHMVNEDPDAML